MPEKRLIVSIFNKRCPGVPEQLFGKVLMSEPIPAKKLDRVIGVFKA